MKVLILGKNGQLGQALASEFKKNQHEVFPFSHKTLDVSDKEKVEKVVIKNKPNAVINATAFHLAASCESDPQKAFAINATAVKNIAEICSKYGILFVHFSTDYVFDGRKGSQYVEGDRPNPLQVYGISKYAGEQMAQNYCSDTLIIRTCGVYGGKRGSREKGGNFILTIRRQIIGKDILEVSSEQIVSPTYAQDLADATYRLITKNLVNEGYCSWAEFAQAIADELKSKIRIIPVDRRGDSGGARRPLFSAIKNTKAKKIGVVLPKWQDALSRYIKDLE